jgi:aminoglycoside 6'-N-acetyltransferase
MTMASHEIAFRPLARRDFGSLSEWLNAPHVKIWWREEADAESIEERYGPIVDRVDPTEVFVIERDEQAIGLIQRYRFDDNPAWQATLSVTDTPEEAVGIDYLIGLVHLTGRGLGPEVIGKFVRETWDRYSDVAAVVVNINEDNRPSWRALEKIGFSRVWTGPLVSDDPSDEGASHVYVLHRPAPWATD